MRNLYVCFFNKTSSLSIRKTGVTDYKIFLRLRLITTPQQKKCGQKRRKSKKKKKKKEKKSRGEMCLQVKACYTKRSTTL